MIVTRIVTMKSITFAILAVLIFSVAVSPVISNGLAFAQTEETKTTKEKMEERSDESKQQKAQQRKDAEERKENSIDKKELSKDKKETSIDKKEQRRANLEERKAQFMEKFSNISEEKKQKLQEKMNIMKEKRSTMNQDTTKERFSGMTIQERQVEVQKILDDRKAERESRQNMTPEEKKAFLDKLKEKMIQKRESHVSPYEQMGLGLDPADVICPEDKELVIKVSDGTPRCMRSDTVVTLLDRGIVEFPE